jgi:hypothetical protein
MGLFTRVSCGAKNPSTPARCDAPNEKGGHTSGAHRNSTHSQQWVDDRSVHQALGMDESPKKGGRR